MQARFHDGASLKILMYSYTYDPAAFTGRCNGTLVWQSVLGAETEEPLVAVHDSETRSRLKISVIRNN